MVLKAPLAIKFALGEDPKSVYHDKDESPVTRMATAALMREQLYKAKEYLARKERAESDPEDDGPDYDAKLEALLPLLWGKIEAHFHAHRADDIFTALRIAKEFAIKSLTVPAMHPHMAAQRLTGVDLPVLCRPHMTARSIP